MEPINAERRFVPAILPWVVAAVALAVFLATLNHLVSLSSLPLVARVSGWTWQPDLYGPLFWLVTFPFRWLPPGLIPVALNIFAAVLRQPHPGLAGPLGRAPAPRPHPPAAAQ